MHTFSISTNCLQNIKGLAQKLKELAGQTMHTKCDEWMDGRTGVKQYAPRPIVAGHKNEVCL